MPHGPRTEKVLQPIWTLSTRTETLRALERETFDLCVIGAGITGAGIALDASLRGLSVLVVEQGDLGSGTSSRSSKLVHGGLRYLRQFEIGLVRTSLAERYALLQLAPHLVKRLPFLLPIYQHDPDGYWKMNAGLWAYDLLCGLHHMGYHRMLSPRRLLEMLPLVKREHLRGGGLYYDAQGDDFRLVLNTLQTAAQLGTRVLSYAPVIGMDLAQGRVSSVAVRDRMTGVQRTARARVFVNATGAWNDRVRCLAKCDQTPRLRNTSGIHLVIARERLPLDHAVMVISPVDRRTLFAIPWQGRVLLGTTDVDYHGDPEAVAAERPDVDYLLASFNGAFPALKLKIADVISAYAGVRPLALKGGRLASEVSREHCIFEDPPNLFNIIGGKLTTYRQMALDLLREVGRRQRVLKVASPVPWPCLHGGERAKDPEIRRRSLERFNRLGLDPAVSLNLIDTYGSEAGALAERMEVDAALKLRLRPDLPYVWAQVEHAIQAEMAMTVEDVLARRLHVLTLDPDHGRSVADRIAEQLGRSWNWEAGRREAAVREYDETVSRSEGYRHHD